jgi:hypothetical protein
MNIQKDELVLHQSFTDLCQPSPPGFYVFTIFGIEALAGLRRHPLIYRFSPGKMSGINTLLAKENLHLVISSRDSAAHSMYSIVKHKLDNTNEIPACQ